MSIYKKDTKEPKENLSNEDHFQIRENIKTYFSINKSLRQSSFKSFIKFINFNQIITSEEDYSSLFNYLLEYQSELMMGNKQQLSDADFNDSYDSDEYDINNECIRLNSCLYAFDELLDTGINEEKRLINVVRSGSVISLNQVIYEDDKENQVTISEMKDIKEAYKSSSLPMTTDTDSLYWSKIVLELLYNKDFNYQENSVDPSERVYSKADISIIISKYPYIKVTSSELMSIIRKLLSYNTNHKQYKDEKDIDIEVKDITFTLAKEVLTLISDRLNQDTEVYNNQMNQMNQMNQINDIRRKKTKSDNEDMYILKQLEELEEEYNEIDKLNMSSYSNIKLMKEIYKLIGYTLESQIKKDFHKVKTGKYEKYEDKDSIIDAISSYINLISYKIEDLDCFINEIIKNERLKRKENHMFKEKIRWIDESIRNSLTIISSYEEVIEELNMKIHIKERINEEKTVEYKDFSERNEEIIRIKLENKELTDKLRYYSKIEYENRQMIEEIEEEKRKNKMILNENSQLLRSETVTKQELTSLKNENMSLIEELQVMKASLFPYKDNKDKKKMYKFEKSGSFKKKSCHLDRESEENQVDFENDNDNDTYINTKGSYEDSSTPTILNSIENQIGNTGFPYENDGKNMNFNVKLAKKEGEIRILEHKLNAYISLNEKVNKEIYIVNKENERMKNLTVQLKNEIELMRQVNESQLNRSSDYLKEVVLLKEDFKVYKVTSESGFYIKNEGRERLIQKEGFSFSINRSSNKESKENKENEFSLRKTSQVLKNIINKSIITKKSENSIHQSLKKSVDESNLLGIPSKKDDFNKVIQNHNNIIKKIQSSIGEIRINGFEKKVSSIEKQLSPLKKKENHMKDMKDEKKNENSILKGPILLKTPSKLFQNSPLLRDQAKKHSQNQSDSEENTVDFSIYDKLFLKNDVFIRNFLEACNENVNILYTSNINHLINNEKMENRKILITTKGVYILNHNDNFILIKLPFVSIGQISICSKNNNLIVFHIEDSIDDFIFEDYHRRDLITFLKAMFDDLKGEIIEKRLNSTEKHLAKVIKIEHIPSLRAKVKGKVMNVLSSKNQRLFTVGKFDNSRKFGYLKQKVENFIGIKSLVDRFVCLSNIGLILFESASKLNCVGFYFLTDCEVNVLSFKGRSLNEKDDSVSEIFIETISQTKDVPERNVIEITNPYGKTVQFYCPSKTEADLWVSEIKRFVVENQIKDQVLKSEFIIYQ